MKKRKSIKIGNKHTQTIDQLIKSGRAKVTGLHDGLELKRVARDTKAFRVQVVFPEPEFIVLPNHRKLKRGRSSRKNTIYDVK